MRYYNPPFPGLPPAGIGRPAPPLPPSAPVRPRVAWIVLSWVLFVALGVGAVIGVVAMSHLQDAVPDQAFASGQWVEITTNPGDEPPVIYTRSAAPGDVRCDIRSSSGPVPALRPAVSRTSLSVDGHEWDLAYRVDAAGPGPYQLTCEAGGGQFGVGTELDAAEEAEQASTFLGWLLVVFAGLVGAIVTTVWVLSRRHAARSAWRASQHRGARPW
jgi:hypothetical protein